MRNSPFDVCIVGAGAAGLYTALCLPQHWQVALISKDDLSLSASDWAQGGIAAVTAPDDTPRLHWEDTLKAGAGLCDPAAVQLLVDEAAVCVASLVEIGVAFDRKEKQLALTREAAHSKPRVLHAADTTGRAIVSTLAEQVLARPNITVFNRTLVLDLWLTEQNRCVGVKLLHESCIDRLPARAIVLATGGGGQVFSHTTNPSLSTGDGVAMAHRAGALLRDLEFFQFHPTALMVPGAPRFLISEAVRGEGAQVFDQQGDRFLFQYHPDGELAPRDVVSRSIFQHLTRHYPDQDYVHLDLRSIPSDRIRYRFPTIIKVCQNWNIDLFQEPIPVSPAAHYWMGGIFTDLQGQTSLPGLYAVGETASTGVHGANRLASNSLLECLVFGRRLAQLELMPLETVPHHQAVSPGLWILSPEDFNLDWLQEVRVSLPQTIWTSAGICRDRDGLEAGLDTVKLWSDRWRQLPLTQKLQNYPLETPVQLQVWDSALNSGELVRLWLEVGNLLQISELILKSALFREESRGGHYRLDCPDTLPQWQCHSLAQNHQLQRSACVFT